MSSSPRSNRDRSDMSTARRRLVSPITSAALCASLLTACGARSDLVDGVPLEPQQMDSACPPGPTTPITQRFGDTRWQVASSIAIDESGYPIIAGAFNNTLDFGFTMLTAPDHDPLAPGPFNTPPLDLEGHFFVARLAPDGCTPFARAYDGDYSPNGAIQLALAGDGLLLTANYRGRVDFGGGEIGLDDLVAGAIVKLGAAGEHVWSHVFRANLLAIPRPAADAQGNVYVAGTFVGNLTFDDAAIGTSLDGRTDAFVAKLDPSGALLWSKMLRLDADWTYASVSVAAWPNGDVAAAGQYANVTEPMVQLDLGAGPMNGPHQTGFVTSFDAAGQHRWQSLTHPLVADARLAPSGALVVAGVWDGEGFPVQRFDTTGATSDPFVIQGPASTVSLALGADDEVLIAGALYPPGGGPFVAAADAAGNVSWTRTFETHNEDGTDRASGALGPGATPWIAGGFMGSMDLGTGPVIASGKWPDVFVAALAP
jgi:hypothetical protein